MSDFRLGEKFAFEGTRLIHETWDGFLMKELPGAPAFWLAVDANGEAALEKACVKLFGCNIPERGRFVAGSAGADEVLLAWVGNRQWLLRGTAAQSCGPIAKVGYLTDQSDGWAGLTVSGERSRDVLATLCPLDLHQDNFPNGSSARAPFEGLHCIILCRDSAEPRFELFCQRSSARSFIENLRHGAYSYCGDRVATDN